MSKRKGPLAGRDELRRQVEQLAIEAFRRAGDLVPVTPEEVAAIEEREGVMPPPRFAPPDLTKPFVRKARVAGEPVNEQVAENLARAAREGRTISPEIEERMKRDRAAARPDEHGNGNGQAG